MTEPSEPEVWDLSFDLLDRQLVSHDGHMVGRVDDVELEQPAPGEAPVVTTILVGPSAYGPRLGGRVGRALAGAAARLRDRSRADLPRIPVGQTVHCGSHLELAAGAERVTLAVEVWLRDHVVGKIPGR